MALYNKLDAVDLISPVVGKFPLESDKSGQLVVVMRGRFDPDIPWINVRQLHWDRCCQLWNQAYFENYRFIPKGCRSCWKVVMEIPTLKEAMRVMDVQVLEREFSCKVGIETRPPTGSLGRFMAFWYGRVHEGLEGGRRLYNKIINQFPEASTYLKRGCTEFTYLYPDTHKWDALAKTHGWDALEEILNGFFLVEEHDFGSTPELLKPRILKRWIDWTYEHSNATGDTTYLEYTEGKPFPPTITYHRSEHKNSDFKGSKFEPRRIRGGVVNYEEDKFDPRSVGSEAEDTGEVQEESKITLLH